MTRWLLLLLLIAVRADAWTIAKTYSDTPQGAAGSMTGGAPVRVFIPAAACLVAAPTSNWDLYSLTDPTPACVTGTVIKKGVLTFAEAGTVCTSTTATTGCAFTTFQLPGDFVSAGRIDVKLLFTSTDTTNGHTIVFSIATKCSTPTISTGGAVDDPATLNASQALTFTNGAGPVSASLRQVSLASITTTGCTGGDLLHVRIGRDKTTDTATTDVNFVGVELTIFNSV